MTATRHSLPDRITIAIACFITVLTLNSYAESKNEDANDSRDAWVAPDQIGKLYGEHCAVCHGDQLQGKNIGPSLLSETYTYGSDMDDVIESIASGYADKGMPAWQHLLDADQIRALAVYILEKKTATPSDASLGLGKPPVIPAHIIKTEKHHFRLSTLFTGLDHPYAIAPLPDGHILATEKAKGLSIISPDGSAITLIDGTPKVFDDGVLRGSTFAGSGWMHDVELHPDYKENGWIYISHGHRCGDCNAESKATGKPVVMVQLLRGRIKDKRWVDEEIIWRADMAHHINGLEVGVGARISFDHSGYVYLSLGNMISDYRGAQDLDKPYGKTLRLHDDGRIPDDNPFVDQAGAVKAIWTLGHRNPQGLSYDLHSDTLWESEHGPRGGDEANVLRAGRNYGWPLVSLGLDYDGSPISYGKKLGIKFDPADLEATVIDWTPSLGVSSITFYQNVFHENQFNPAQHFSQWHNDMLVATLSQNDLIRVDTEGDKVLYSETIIKDLGRFRDIEVAWNGDIILLLEHASGSSIISMKRTDQATGGDQPNP